jgi:hypothetical protein
VKALTLWQPWASLIALERKLVETRSWSTSYRGPLAIHAAKRRPDVETMEDGPAGEIFDPATDDVACQWAETPRQDFFPDRIPPPEYRWWISLAPDHMPDEMPLGAIVATCELVGCEPTGLIRWQDDPGFTWKYMSGEFETVRMDSRQRCVGDFTPGRFAWLLCNVKRLDPPVPSKGLQQLWEWSK